MVPYYSSDEEGGDDGESVDSGDEAHQSPSEEEEEGAVISRLSREGGVSFLSFLVSKAVPVREENEPKEWTYKDMIGLPASQLEEWRAACQREIEILTKRHVRADLGGHLKYSRRWSGVRAGVLLGAQGAVRRGESRGKL